MRIDGAGSVTTAYGLRMQIAERLGTPDAVVVPGGSWIDAAGLLNGRSATTNHAALEELSQYGAIVRQNRVVDDGAVVTAGGVTSGVDLALWLVQRECGAETAGAVRRAIAYPVQPDVWRAPGVVTE